MWMLVIILLGPLSNPKVPVIFAKDYRSESVCKEVARGMNQIIEPRGMLAGCWRQP